MFTLISNLVEFIQKMFYSLLVKYLLIKDDAFVRCISSLKVNETIN